MNAQARGNITDMVRKEAEELGTQAKQAVDTVLPDDRRTYSFNALIAAGVLGFIVGRICAR